VVRGPEPVQGQPTDDDHQPRSQVLDLLDPLDGEPGERVLDHVLGLGPVGKDPGGDGQEVAAVLVPGGRNGIGHGRQDDRDAPDVTRTAAASHESARGGGCTFDV